MATKEKAANMRPIRIRYQTIEFGEFDIHVKTLRDKQQYCDSSGKAQKLGISSATWPMFGVIWESGEFLAHLMVDHSVEGKRILEVGCGIGLASLVLNHCGADITATDYHPEAEAFLKANTILNNDPDISFVRTAWGDQDTKALGLFDLIIGSDLLYEEEHAKNLASFINQHSQNRCTVLIIDPGRGHSAKFTRYMTNFGFSLSLKQHQPTNIESREFKGKTLCFRR